MINLEASNLVDEILTDEFQDFVVELFLKMHEDITEDDDVRNACKVLLKYISVPSLEESDE